MNINFSDIIDEVKKLSFGEKEELMFIINRYIVDERREQIYNYYKESLREFKGGKMEFSNKVDKMKGMIG